MIRGAGAVVAGFLVVVVLSTLTDVAMHAAGVFPPLGQPMSGSRFGLALAYRVAFTVLGGWVTARLSPARPMRHVGWLAGLGQLGGLAGVGAWFAADDQAMGPLWYPVAIAVTAIPGVLAGGRLRAGG